MPPAKCGGSAQSRHECRLKPTRETGRSGNNVALPRYAASGRSQPRDRQPGLVQLRRRFRLRSAPRRGCGRIFSTLQRRGWVLRSPDRPKGAGGCGQGRDAFSRVVTAVRATRRPCVRIPAPGTGLPAGARLPAADAGSAGTLTLGQGERNPRFGYSCVIFLRFSGRNDRFHRLFPSFPRRPLPALRTRGRRALHHAERAPHQRQPPGPCRQGGRDSVQPAWTYRKSSPGPAGLGNRTRRLSLGPAAPGGFQRHGAPARSWGRCVVRRQTGLAARGP